MHVPDLRVKAEPLMTFVEQATVLLILKHRLYLLAQQYAFRCETVENASAGLVRLGFKRDAHSRCGVHRLSHSLRQAAAHTGQVDPKRICATLDARPDNQNNTRPVQGT